MNLSGKVALIVGASRGIGLAIARALAAAGAHTILTARSQQDLEAEAVRLRESGASAEARPLDVSDLEAVDAFCAALPAVDIVIGVSGTNIRKPFVEYTPEEVARLMRVNLDGFVRLSQGIGRNMIARGKGGKFVFIGSLTSLLGLPYVSIYGITKSALAGLTRGLAAEWGRYQIQVNCIAPGFILTDLNRAMWQDPVMKNWLEGGQANPRMGTPEDIAPLAVFLSSSGSDYITGQVIAVDGGYTTTGVWPFEP